MSFKHTLANHFQCNSALNKKAICLKRSWDEVSRILDHACRKKCDCDRPKHKK